MAFAYAVFAGVLAWRWLRCWRKKMNIFTSKCAPRHNGGHRFDISTQLPKALWTWGVLYILTSKCASRHNGVQFFIFHLASWLRTRRLREPIFRPYGATKHWKKTQCLATSLPFPAPASSFFWLSPTLIFISYLLPSDFLHAWASSWLCFSSVHIVGTLVSKLPSIVYIYISISLSLSYMCILCIFTTNTKRHTSSEALHLTGSNGLFWVGRLTFTRMHAKSCWLWRQNPVGINVFTAQKQCKRPVKANFGFPVYPSIRALRIGSFTQKTESLVQGLCPV